MMEQIQAWYSSFVLSDSMLSLITSSVILFMVIIALRALLSRFIRRSVASNELRRKWMVQSRNGLLLLLMLGLILIWGEELRTLALSIVAIAVAFVVATKELILCVIGTILKTVSNSFDLGDRIQIKDFRGDVIDQNILATTIMEVGPGKITHQRTGRTMVIPNAMFVSEPVINESFTHDYVFHVFTVPFKREDDWHAAQLAFLQSAKRHSASYLEEVRKYMNRISIRRGLEIPSVDPRVTIQVPTAGELHLIIRVPVKSGERGFIEQAILTDVFQHNDFIKKPEKKVEAADSDLRTDPEPGQ
ncbi:MAG: mechanosensitive ion channel [Pseudohongiella sp.]|nr:mechanosensitive ion channel [Pseudohongiella sp.]MDO9519065.1 mechanosensitive ion channel [Pseudohongiella sp.]MDP2129070.1 mechanosensitive ion channel [Pseudohongiella sp.]